MRNIMEAGIALMTGVQRVPNIPIGAWKIKTHTPGEGEYHVIWQGLGESDRPVRKDFYPRRWSCWPGQVSRSYFRTLFCKAVHPSVLWVMPENSLEHHLSFFRSYSGNLRDGGFRQKLCTAHGRRVKSCSLGGSDMSQHHSWDRLSSVSSEMQCRDPGTGISSNSQ